MVFDISGAPRDTGIHRENRDDLFSPNQIAVELKKETATVRKLMSLMAADGQIIRVKYGKYKAAGFFSEEEV